MTPTPALVGTGFMQTLTIRVVLLLGLTELLTIMLQARIHPRLRLHKWVTFLAARAGFAFRFFGTVCALGQNATLPLKAQLATVSVEFNQHSVYHGNHDEIYKV